MKRLKKPLNFLLSTLPYIIVFIFALYTPSDPDLGWHLKYGEYFFQHGNLLRDNTFSTLMPDYQWANTSWLTDVISYALFQNGGFLALTIAGALVVTATMFFFSRAAKLTRWDQAFLFPLILFLEQPINAISFRGQQLTLLLIGVLFYLLSFYPKKPKILLLTIPLFFLWANLHGQFIFGLVLFGGWIGLYLLTGIASTTNIKSTTSLRKKFQLLARGIRDTLGTRDTFFLVGIFIASTLITVLNPFGIGIHTAALSHFGNPLLKSIAEYLPFDVQSQAWWNQVIVGVGITIGCIFLYFQGKLRNHFPLLGTSLIVYALSFGVRRYAWPAYYMIMPMVQPIIGFLKPDSKKATSIMTTIFLIVLLVIAVASRYPFTKYTQYNWNEYCKSYATKCSSKSAEFITENRLTDNVYTLYGWGGWLIWNYPQIKPVIDGRMHLWKDTDGYSGFIDYYAYEQNLEDINTSSYDVVYMSPDKPLYARMEQLVSENKWKLVYQDDLAGVFVRND